MKRTRASVDERGSALLIALFMVSTIAVMSAAYLMISVESLQSSRAATEEVQAFYMAEAGLNGVVAELFSSAADGDIEDRWSFQTGRCWVEKTELADGNSLVLATGVVGNRAQTLQMVIAQPSTSVFQGGAFGKDSLVLDDQATVDSYDSSLGPYASQAKGSLGGTEFVGKRGHLGSNGPIDVAGGSMVFGSAVTGPLSSVDVAFSAHLEGFVDHFVGAVEFPDVEYPDIPSMGSFALTGTQSLCLVPGLYRADSISADGDVEINLTGPCVLLMDSLTLSGSAKVTAHTKGGLVRLVVLHDLAIGPANVVENSSNDPQRLLLWTTADNVDGTDVVQLDLETELHGIVYAPDARIELADGALFGAIAARELVLRGEVGAHFDESLVHPRQVFWRELDGHSTLAVSNADEEAELDARVRSWMSGWRERLGGGSVVKPGMGAPLDVGAMAKIPIIE